MGGTSAANVGKSEKQWDIRSYNILYTFERRSALIMSEIGNPL
jgi:hypothetical protein